MTMMAKPLCDSDVYPRWPNGIDDDAHDICSFVSQCNFDVHLIEEDSSWVSPLCGFALAFDLNLRVSIMHAFLLLFFIVPLH